MVNKILETFINSSLLPVNAKVVKVEYKNYDNKWIINVAVKEEKAGPSLEEALEKSEITLNDDSKPAEFGKGVI